MPDLIPIRLGHRGRTSAWSHGGRAWTGLAALALLATAGCASSADAADRSAGRPAPQLAVPAAQAPPDLAGHQFDRPHAAQVLVAGDTTDVDLPTGRVRLRVNGPALVPVTTFTPRKAGELRRWAATFTITASGVTGAVPLGADAFTLLDLAPRQGPVRVPPTATALTTTTLTPGQTVTGTWSAPVVEGHGEFLYAPAGVAPQALWDFRAEG